jgi:vanillate/3-O-methylgallate O-demethylase
MSKEIIQSLRSTESACLPFAETILPEYTDWREEQMASKESVCIGNWSFAGWAYLEGPGATQLLQDHAVNSFRDCPIGQVKHLVGCTEAGKVIGEGILMKLGEEKFKMATLPYWHYIASLHKYDAVLTLEPAGTTAIFQVCGPRSVQLLEEVANESLRDIPFMHFRAIKIGDRDVLATNGLTMSGEIGLELH